MSSLSEVSSESSSFVKDLSLSLRLNLSKTDWIQFSEQKTDANRIHSLIQNPKVLQEISNCIEKHSICNSDNRNPSGIASSTQAQQNGESQFDSAKNRRKALSFKEQGNKVFGQGDNTKALEFYSKALTWIPSGPAEDGTPDMAILHGNRSAALFHLKEYSLAQMDIELAFKLNYPVDLGYKLYERSARCFLQEGKKAQASTQLQKALKVISSSMAKKGEEEANKLIKTKSSLETLLKSLSSSGTGTGTGGTTFQNFESSTSHPLKTLPPLPGGQTKALKNASSKVLVKYSETEGRFVVATQNILPGEVILVEKAFVSAVTPEFYHRHCLQCFNPLRAPIPCLTCSMVSFCSVRCRNDAWKTHHQFECKILGILRQSGISITCLMALRVLTQGGPSSVLKWFDMVKASEDEEGMKRPPAEVGGGGGEEYKAEDFSSLCQLVTHSGKRIPEDFFQRAIMALFLLSLLRRTSFIQSIGLDSTKVENGNGKGGGTDGIEGKVSGGNNEVYPSKEEGKEEEKVDKETERVHIVVGTLLLRLLQLLQFNAHEVSAWDNASSKSIFLGGGLFPTLAFFNHSCNPAIVRYFVNDTVIVRAVRTIQRGEPITENYGPVFTEMRKSDRQAQLETQYWFQCGCISCVEDWPLFNELKRDDLNFRCAVCRAFLCKSSSESMALLLRCARCNRPTSILKSLKSLQESEGKYNQAMELMKKGRPESAVGILEQNISLFDSILCPPFRDYHWCQEGLRKCYLAQGNETL